MDQKYMASWLDKFPSHFLMFVNTVSQDLVLPSSSSNSNHVLLKDTTSSFEVSLFTCKMKIPIL